MNTSEKTLLFLKELFKLMKIGRLVDLKYHGLRYSDHLDWFVVGELGCAGAAMLTLIHECFPESLPLAGWFGGKMAVCKVPENSLGEIHRTDTVSIPVIATVHVNQNGNLQDCFDNSFLNTGLQVLENLHFGDTIGNGFRYERMSELPRVMFVQIARRPPLTLTGDGLNEFYSILTYGMKLDARKALLDPTSVECTEFKLVSFIARQTTWCKITGSKEYESEGHYKAVCSSLEKSSNELKWTLVDDAKVTRNLSSREVLHFDGEDKRGDTRLNKKRNKHCANEKEFFVECFCFVRNDCLTEFYKDL